MLDLAAILSVLREVGERFPVDRWQIDGVHVWPLVRYFVASWNFELTARPVAAPVARPAHRLRRVARAVSRSSPASLARHADVLLYSDGVSYTEVEGAFYDRFVDPVVAFANERGLSTAVLTPHHLYRWPVWTKTTYVQPVVDGTQLVAAMLSRLARPRLLSLEGFEDAAGHLRRAGARTLPDVQTLARAALQARTHARLFEALLARVRPRVALLPSYIGTERMALALACHRAGVPCVDIQHGAAGETHWAYGGMGRQPQEGYELVPSRFWCWTADDAAAISRWASPERHRPVVAGVPFVEAWREGRVPGTPAARASLATRSRSQKEICFVLSGYETPALLDAYLDCAAARRDTFFWVRTHPLRPEQRASLEARLGARGLRSTVDVELASQVPLPALLERVDGLVLELSSSAFEAAMFGVPSLLMSPATGTVYEGLVQRGLAQVVSPGDLHRGVAAVRRGRPWGPTQAEVRSGVDALLAP